MASPPLNFSIKIILIKFLSNNIHNATEGFVEVCPKGVPWGNEIQFDEIVLTFVLVNMVLFVMVRHYTLLSYFMGRVPLETTIRDWIKDPQESVFMVTQILTKGFFFHFTFNDNKYAIEVVM